MTLEEAIEIVERWYAGGYATRIDDMNPAIKLLIEAGKFTEAIRQQEGTVVYMLLPGETKERTLQREGKDISGSYFYEERQKC